MSYQATKKKWPTTRWSLVKLAAGELDGVAMQELLKHYLKGLRTHLITARGIPVQNADDVLQGFMLNKVLRENWLHQAQHSRGRFRTFLLTSLDRYLVSELRKATASKRAPKSIVHFDGTDEQEHMALGTTNPDVAASLDLVWIRERIDEALALTRDACLSANRENHWKLFADRVVNPILYGTNSRPYAEFVAELGFKTPLNASNAITTVKRMWARSFRAVIADHTPGKTAFEHELRELWKILAAFDSAGNGYEN
jgi:DNA-directed RNA polymerase specialized sigma24 family protein